MPLRDIALALVLAGLFPLGVMHPWIGVMLWSWLSLMSPHRMTFGFMYDAPVSMMSGVVAIAGLLLFMRLAGDRLWLKAEVERLVGDRDR